MPARWRAIGPWVMDHARDKPHIVVSAIVVDKAVQHVVLHLQAHLQRRPLIPLGDVGQLGGVPAHIAVHERVGDTRGRTVRGAAHS